MEIQNWEKGQENPRKANGPRMPKRKQMGYWSPQVM